MGVARCTCRLCASWYLTLAAFLHNEYNEPRNTDPRVSSIDFSSFLRSESLSFSASSSCRLASDATAVPSRYSLSVGEYIRHAATTDHGVFHEFNWLIYHPLALLPAYLGHRFVLKQWDPRWGVSYCEEWSSHMRLGVKEIVPYGMEGD